MKSTDINVALANGTIVTLSTCSECGNSLCPSCHGMVATLQEESYEYSDIVSDSEDDEPIPF